MKPYFLICAAALTAALFMHAVSAESASVGSVVVKDGRVYVDGRDVGASSDGVTVVNGQVVEMDAEAAAEAKRKRDAEKEALKRSIKESVQGSVDKEAVKRAAKQGSGSPPPGVVNRGGKVSVGKVELSKDAETGTVTINGKETDPDSLRVE